MQNLTVIPGHWDEKRTWFEGGYTLVIGHRRHAAAKLAGIKELPCRIVEGMSEKEQMTTMLKENMHRNDLSIWETTIRHRLNITKLLYALVIIISCFLSVTITVMDNQYSNMKKQNTILTWRTQGMQGDIYELNYRTGLLFSHQEYIVVESITRKNDSSVVFTVSDGSIKMDNGTAIWTHDDGNISKYYNATIRPYE